MFMRSSYPESARPVNDEHSIYEVSQPDREETQRHRRGDVAWGLGPLPGVAVSPSRIHGFRRDRRHSWLAADKAVYPPEPRLRNSNGGSSPAINRRMFSRWRTTTRNPMTRLIQNVSMG